MLIGSNTPFGGTSLSDSRKKLTAKHLLKQKNGHLVKTDTQFITGNNSYIIIFLTF